MKKEKKNIVVNKIVKKPILKITKVSNGYLIEPEFISDNIGSYVAHTSSEVGNIIWDLLN